MGILSWIVFGLIAGLLAKWLLPGKDPGGLVVTCALGIVGAVVGGFLATELKLATMSGFTLEGVAIAVGGAMLVLIAYRFIRSRM